MFQTQISISNRIYSMKYQKLCCKDITIRKSEFVAKTQLFREFFSEFSPKFLKFLGNTYPEIPDKLNHNSIKLKTDNSDFTINKFWILGRK